MHRARWLVAAAWLAHADASRAERWTAHGELGGELDSNITRVAPTSDDDGGELAAASGLVAARAGLAGRRAGLDYALGASGAWRDVARADLADEDRAVLAADASVRRRVRADAVSVGARASVYDVSGLGAAPPARAFQATSAAGTLGLVGDRGHRLDVDAGVRHVRYKPDDDHTWTGPSLGADLSWPLWTSVDDTRQLDLALAARADLRAYHGQALVSVCPPGEPPSTSCLAPAAEARQDLVQSLGVELTYTAAVVASAGYQLTRVASTSVGQSLLRHRVSAAATVLLPGELYATATLVLQRDQFLDGLLVAGDLAAQSWVTLDDDSRSSVQVRLARALGHGVGVEARLAGWHDLGGAGSGYQRGVVAVGVTWDR
jgi:hypothetical protein